MFNIGAFLGHIVRATKAEVPTPGASERRVVREEVQTQVRETPEGKMTLRRTTIEEIEIDRTNPSGPIPPPTP